MAQTWHDLLFAHWPVKPELLRGLVPPELSLDLYDGRAWVGVVPFWMSGIRARGVPALPGLSRFPELNVRTYVVLGQKPGVYFFSLDAANAPAVWAARKFFYLPYFRARISATATGQALVYESRRMERPDAEFRGRYGPVGDARERDKESIERWLTERYCLYTVRQKKVYCADIHHAPWSLQDAEAEIEVNTMASAAGIRLPAVNPLLHFAKKQEVVVWRLKCVNGR
jgi:uncharacterized protein